MSVMHSFTYSSQLLNRYECMCVVLPRYKDTETLFVET